MLGTGYGECKLKKRTSKEYRGRGGVIVDDTLLIDAPADLLSVADELAMSDMLKTVTDIIISHSHEGHFCPEVIDKMAKKRKIRVYGWMKTYINYIYPLVMIFVFVCLLQMYF